MGSHSLYAVNSDAQLLWKYDIYQGCEPAIGPNGTVYIGDTNYLYAISPNGNKIWQSPMLSNGRWVRSPVLDPDGGVYTVGKVGPCTACQYVYALNPSDGSVAWQTGQNAYSTALSLDDQGGLYIGSFRGTARAGLHDLSSSNGSEKWYAFETGGIIDSIPAVSQDTIYVGTYYSNSVCAVSKTDGIVTWTFHAEDQLTASPVIDSQGVVYIGARDWTFYALNPDGSTKWQAELSDRIVSNAAIGADGTVYVGADDGNLYAFGE